MVNTRSRRLLTVANVVTARYKRCTVEPVPAVIKVSVKDSGYLTRILSMLCLDTKLSETECCTTSVDNLPSVYIKNKFILKK